MRRLEAITGMRGVAALLVVGFHAVLVVWLAQITVALAGDGNLAGADAFRHPLSAGLFGGGWIGVDFFFVLSGFLLGRPLLAVTHAAPIWAGYRLFALKRLLRIAPPYYASFVTGYALAGWSQHPAYVASAKSLAIHATYLHSFFPRELFAINGVYWTLAIELQFYLLLPLLAIPFRRFGVKSVAVFVAVAVLYSTFVQASHDQERVRFLAFQFPAFLAHFGFGLAAAQLSVQDWRPRGAPDVLIVSAIALLIVVPAMALGYTRQFEPVAAWPYGILLRPAAALAFAVSLFLSLQPQSRFGQALSWRPLVHAGEVSYSLYLIHLPLAGFFLVTNPAAIVALGLPAFMVVLMAGSLALATAFYVLVERPSLALKTRIAKRLEATPPA